jgi:PAT family beta-lactamase induction signal transducer AmpG
VGVGAGTVALVAIVVGTFVGGLMTQSRGLGPALWISGVLQLVSNLGYALVAEVGPHRPTLYAATLIEYLTTGMGNGAFWVLLLRLTQKRFSATQYALLSSLFTLPRIVAGPPAGLLADALGWRNFFVLTLAFGIPGLAMLQRFVPWGVREPELRAAAPNRGPRLSDQALLLWSALAGAAAWATGAVALAGLAAIKAYRAGEAFEMVGRMAPFLDPRSSSDWLSAAGVLSMATITAMAAAAALVARRAGSPAE